MKGHYRTIQTSGRHRPSTGATTNQSIRRTAVLQGPGRFILDLGHFLMGQNRRWAFQPFYSWAIQRRRLLLISDATCIFEGEPVLRLGGRDVRLAIPPMPIPVLAAVPTHGWTFDTAYRPIRTRTVTYRAVTGLPVQLPGQLVGGVPIRQTI